MKKSALDGLKSFSTENRHSEPGPELNLPIVLDTDSSFAKIPLRLITPNPAQPRRRYSEERLQELVLSIKERGILQPIRVAETGPSEYQIIAGERRFRAAALAGLTEIPAVVVRGQPSEQSYLDAIVENLVRENLNPLDRALALSRVRTILGGGFKEVAQRVGLTERRLFHLMGLINLPESVQERIRAGKLNEKHGRALRLLQKQPHLMRILLTQIEREGLSGDAAIKRGRQLYSDSPPVRYFTANYRTRAELRRILQEKIAELNEEEAQEGEPDDLKKATAVDN